MAKKRSYSPKFKAKVALAAVRENQTLNQIASHFKIHTNQVSNWKGKLVRQAEMVFEASRNKADPNQQALIDELYQQIGKLQMELEWTKKKSALFD